MTAPDPILAAIAAHRAAYDAFQVAAEGEASILADAAYRDAGDGLMETDSTTPAGAVKLLEHLRWWIAEEAAFADSYGLTYRAAQVRVADLTVLACACWPASAVGPDPIHRAIATVESAEAAHNAALAAVKKADDTQVGQADAAAEAAAVVSAAAFDTVTAITPTSRAGLFALADFYAREAEVFESTCSCGQYLRHLATALETYREATSADAYRIARARIGEAA